MAVTYRKQVYISLVLTDSFHQTAIWAHSTQRIKCFEKCFLQSPQLCPSAFSRFLWYHLSAVFPRYFLKPLTFSSLPFILYLLHSSSCSDIQSVAFRVPSNCSILKFISSISLLSHFLRVSRSFTMSISVFVFLLQVISGSSKTMSQNAKLESVLIYNVAVSSSIVSLIFLHWPTLVRLFATFFTIGKLNNCWWYFSSWYSGGKIQNISSSGLLIDSISSLSSTVSRSRSWRRVG